MFKFRRIHGNSVLETPLSLFVKSVCGVSAWSDEGLSSQADRSSCDSEGRRNPSQATSVSLVAPRFALTALHPRCDAEDGMVQRLYVIRVLGRVPTLRRAFRA